MVNGVAVPTFPTFIRNTGPGSVGGIPGISLPVGMTKAGLAGRHRNRRAARQRSSDARHRRRDRDFAAEAACAAEERWLVIAL